MVEDKAPFGGAPGRMSLPRWTACLALAMLACVAAVMLRPAPAASAVVHPGPKKAHAQALPATAEVEIVRFPLNRDDPRAQHNIRLLNMVMDRTVKRYGPWRLEYCPLHLQRERMLSEIARDGLVNVAVFPPQYPWDRELNVIRIPVDKGLLGYRILLANTDSLPALAKVRTAEDLKRLRIGSQMQWTTTTAFEKLGFNVITASSYTSLFRMLAKGRFDCVPRGLNEVFREYDQWKDELPGLSVEPGLVLVMPLPNYFVVSPGRKRLTQRLNDGLEEMIRDGSFDKLFQESFGADIKHADLEHRRVIRLTNPLLKDDPAFKRKELWYVPGRMGN